MHELEKLLNSLKQLPYPDSDSEQKVYVRIREILESNLHNAEVGEIVRNLVTEYSDLRETRLRRRSSDFEQTYGMHEGRYLPSLQEEIFKSIGSCIIPYLDRLFTSKESENKEHACVALRGILHSLDSPKDIKQFENSLHVLYQKLEEQGGLTEYIQKNLTKFLIEVLEKKSKQGDREAINILIIALKDQNSRAYTSGKIPLVGVKVEAARVLGYIKEISAIPALVDILSDEDEGVRLEAVISIEKILENCRTVGELQNSEEKLLEGFTKLKKKCRSRERIKKIKIRFADWKMKLANRKNQLTQSKGIRLTGAPKPPKRGQIFKQLGYNRNG